MFISQFFILSPRGDVIIIRDFRHDVPRGTSEIFFRYIKSLKASEPTPIFQLDRIHYFFVKKCGLYFVCTGFKQIAPSWGVELLNKMIKVFKDYCGVLNEESMRRNFVLIYELVDEMIDFGFPQTTNTEALRNCVHNEAVPVDTPKSLVAFATGISSRTVPSSAVHRPISGSNRQLVPQENSNSLSSMAASWAGRATQSHQKNEIFVDILERLTVILDNQGAVVNASIDGTIQMKSYLEGHPELRLALNDDILIGGVMGGITGLKADGFSQRASVYLDDCNFHECVDLSLFSSQRVIAFYPPDGEFAVMNYRTSNEFRVPFRVIPYLEEISDRKLELVLKIRAEIPDANYGGNVKVECPMPIGTTGVSTDLLPTSVYTQGGQSAEYVMGENRLNWIIKKLPGGQEFSLRARISVQTSGSRPSSLESRRREMSPIALAFEIPMYNASNLQVKYLRIAEKPGLSESKGPHRWVRYVTQSASYISRLT